MLCATPQHLTLAFWMMNAPWVLFFLASRSWLSLWRLGSMPALSGTVTPWC